MRKFTMFAILTAIVLSFGAMYVMAEDATEDAAHDYVGFKKCKTCHKAQYKAWLETGHATAMDRLSDEEKANPDCIKCHSTGNLADGTLLEGVQCESCHGAGKDYKSSKIMSKKKWKADPETHKKMALDAGLILPVEKDCVRCHTKEGNDNYKEFKFEDRKDEVHPAPAKPAEGK